MTVPLVTISIRTFLQTGHFGPVKVDMHINEVRQLLGPPDDHFLYNDDCHALLYGYFELFYQPQEKRIYAIQNDHLLYSDQQHRLNISISNGQANIEKWFLRYTRSTNYTEVISALNKEGIKFLTDKPGHDDLRIISSGITLDFETDPRTGERALNGIRYFPVHIMPENP